jgi:hypothetical protein
VHWAWPHWRRRRHPRGGVAGTAAGVGAVVGVGPPHGLPDGKLDGDPGGDLDGDGVPVGHGVDHVTLRRLDFMAADASSGGGSAARGDHAGFSSTGVGKKTQAQFLA